MMLQDKNLPLPAGLILFSPVVDHSLPNHDQSDSIDPILGRGWVKESLEAYLAGIDSDTPGLSVNGQDRDIRGFPEMLIQVGTKEILLDDALLLESVAESQGVASTVEVYEDMWHDFQLQVNAGLPSAALAMKSTAEFIKRKLGDN